MASENSGGYHNLSVRMKRTLAVLCTAALIGTSVPVISAAVTGTQAQAASQPIYARTTTSVNLRKGAGMNYQVIDVLGKNESLTVTDVSDKDWIKVKTSGGAAGYISSEYIDITTDAKAETYLNIRKGPGTGYAAIKTVGPGTKFDVLGFSGASWVRVKTSDGTQGYVCCDYDYISYLSGGSTDTKVKTDADTSEIISPGADAQVTISAKNLSLSVGKTSTLTAKTTSGGYLSWKSQNPSVATVTSKGLVTAVKVGTAKITVSDSKSDKTATCTVTVTKSVLDSIKLPSSSGTLTIGQSTTLKPTISPSNGKVTYSSSDSSVASVNGSGYVKALKAGTATITVKDAAGGSAKAAYKVTVKAKANISISSTYQSIRAGANCKLTASLSDGGAVKWTSSNTGIAAVRNGVVSGISAGTVTITASDSTGTVKATCKVSVSGVDSSGVSLSRYSATIPAGKTLYIQGYASGGKWWNTSDSNIATVSEGFILGKNPGKCAITLTDGSGHRTIFTLTVNEANPVRFTYSSPNSAVKNSTVKLIAITDKNRKQVRFDIKVNGKTVTVNATNKVADGNTYVWTGYYKPKTAGTFEYAACANAGSGWVTCNDGKADIFVSDKTDKKTTAIEPLRASDEVIRFIGEKEGFVSNITYDRLANNLPTIAHGYVVWEGQTFYNALTRNEGYALLVDAVNNDNYTRDVNSMLISNNARFNQQQFDALVSFSYNLGTGWTYSSNLKNIVLNSYGNVTTTSSGNSMTAYVNVSNGLNLRESYTTNSKVIKVLSPNEKVTLVSTQKYNSVWYKVKTSDGTVGYCSGTYLTIGSSSSSTKGRDLNYVNKNALINELLSYHHAGGVCYYGLLYRRVDEAEMYIYGDYEADGRSNKHNFPSPSCLSF